MELKAAILEGLKHLEDIHDLKFKEITKEEIANGLSQDSIPLWKFLNLNDTSAVSRYFRRCCPKLKGIKNSKVHYRPFILGLVNKFYCYKCKKVLDLVNKIKGDAAYKCKECDRQSSKVRRDKYRQIVYDYLLDNSCTDCGEKDPIVLEFDHLIPKEKEYNIANMHHSSELALFKEIEKCEVVCANCHRRRTAKTQNWYKNIKNPYSLTG